MSNYRSFASLIDTDPEPVAQIPQREKQLTDGRRKDPRYVALQAKLQANPGVDHRIATLPADTPRKRKNARTAANSLRSTLRRYGVKTTERTVGGELVIFARYTNGTTP